MNKRINRNNSLHITVLAVLLSFAAIFLMRTECYAAEDTIPCDVENKIDGIIEDFDSIIPNGTGVGTKTDELMESVGIKSVLSGILSVLVGQGGGLMNFMLSLVGVALVGSLLSSEKGELSAAVSRGIGVVTSAMMLERLVFLFRGVGQSLSEISEFFAAVIPITVTVNSLGVSPATASTQAIGMGVTLGAFSFIAESVIMPVVSAILISAAASSVDPLFSKISKGVKSTFLSLIGIFTVLLGATFSLQNAISVSSDSALMRSARYAVAGSVPIVGNAVSGALGLVSGGVAYARGIVGGGAIAVIVTLMLSPLVTLFAYRICMKMGAFFCSVSSGGCDVVINSFLGALDCLIALYSLCATIYIVELAAFLKGGIGVA